MEAGELFLGAVLSKAPHAAHEALLTLLPLPGKAVIRFGWC
jgi:hypothetical protein